MLLINLTQEDRGKKTINRISELRKEVESLAHVTKIPTVILF